MSDRTEDIFGFIRRVVCMILGIVVLLNGLWTDNDARFGIISSMIFVGILPIDRLITVWAKRSAIADALTDDEPTPRSKDPSR